MARAVYRPDGNREASSRNTVSAWSSSSATMWKEARLLSASSAHELSGKSSTSARVCEMYWSRFPSRCVVMR